MSTFKQVVKYNIRVEDIMIRDVRYITLNCCYRDLHNVLLTGHLKTLALVESIESMILLGSIERAQLQALLSMQLGRSRRLEFIRERAMEEKKRLSVVSNLGSEDCNAARQPGGPLPGQRSQREGYRDALD
ncbi:hypothetical protein KUCAC02_037926 [Chaenocephalus aceratus]|nr:hypothetical protein KUCAC02_037926 [Chaenocephalus aceratus]